MIGLAVEFPLVHEEGGLHETRLEPQRPKRVRIIGAEEKS